MELYEILRLVLALVLGTVVAHPIASALIYPIVKTVDPRPPKYKKLAEGLGNVERALFICAFFLNQMTFIAAWLGLKVAVKWHSWIVPRNASDEEGQLARAQYLLFLYGSGISALLALAAFLLSRPLFDFLVSFF